MMRLTLSFDHSKKNNNNEKNKKIRKIIDLILKKKIDK